ncbi:hypothetical protein E2C01_076605 [Portunus trituberculatus]|uniref:Uncharacterized protein n=1 Tax=Portunus trituberculatus TaxID=210409 RepID=A0A5B7II27_PORTR|nr:hypothetical protein [Portunus trituberculatus]
MLRKRLVVWEAGFDKETKKEERKRTRTISPEGVEIRVTCYRRAEHGASHAKEPWVRRARRRHLVRELRQGVQHGRHRNGLEGTVG